MLDKIWWYCYLDRLALSLEDIILVFKFSYSKKVNVINLKHTKWLVLAVVFAFYGSFIKLKMYPSKKDFKNLLN